MKINLIEKREIMKDMLKFDALFMEMIITTPKPPLGRKRDENTAKWSRKMRRDGM